MSLLEYTKLNRLDERRPLYNFKPFVTVKVDLDKTEWADHPTQNRYSLTLSVEAQFWANNAQLGTAKRHAERLVLNKLYSGMLNKIDQISHAVYQDDKETAMLILNEIRSELAS